MIPRLLIGSSGLPGVGGLATVGYERFAHLVADGADAWFVNLLKPGEAESTGREAGHPQGNPERLDHVSDVTLGAGGADALAALVQRGNPEVIIGLGHAATLALRGAAPDRWLVFMPGTCRQAQEAVTSGLAPDAITLDAAITSGALAARILHRDEEAALGACDLLIANSALSLSMFQHFHPAMMGRIWPEAIPNAEWTCAAVRRWQHLALPFDQRDIDVCVVASDWARPEKNYRWIEVLASELDGVTIHVVGKVPHEIPGVVHHGFLAAREDLMTLLGRTRCVASPSIIDAAPGVLYEASVMGCNTVASRNCGNWELCAPELLVEPFTIARFAATVRHALPNHIPDRMGAILAAGGHASFLATLDALVSPPVPWGPRA